MDHGETAIRLRSIPSSQLKKPQQQEARHEADLGGDKDVSVGMDVDVLLRQTRQLWAAQRAASTPNS
jgi:hypothetical protein